MSKAFSENQNLVVISIHMEILTHVDSEVDKSHVHVLVHGDGLPGCLVLLCVDICQVASIVMLK